MQYCMIFYHGSNTAFLWRIIMLIDYKKGILNSGNTYRLNRVFEKAEKGLPITVGFIGGSITQGCLSSSPATCYAYRVFEWWQNTFKNSKVTYVNAGIGGTPSDFGVARVQEDLLDKNPDFVIVEFSVNDDSTAYYQENYEGLIRKVLKADNEPALLTVHSVCYDSGKSAENIHLAVSKHYDLPALSMKSTIYEKVADNPINVRDITPDDLHPNDYGHELMASVIMGYLTDVLNASDSAFDYLIPSCYTENLYENARRINNTNSKPQLFGFEADTSVQNHITEMFRNGFYATKEGSYASFELECACISVQFRKTINKPSPIAKLVVDGDEASSVVLDGNFDENWGDCLTTLPILRSSVRKLHNIKITIIRDHLAEVGDETPFYLTSLIVS